MLNWSESSFAYSGKSPTPTFTSNLPAGFQATSNAAQGNLEKNVGTYKTTVPVTFRNSDMEFTANIPYSYTVTPVTLTASVKNASREYGEANPSFQSEYSGFVSGENSSGSEPSRWAIQEMKPVEQMLTELSGCEASNWR